MSSRPYKVWKITTTGIVDNTYKTSREDTWKLIELDSFETESDAKDRVKELTRTDSSTTGQVSPWLILCKTDEEKDNVLNDFCFKDSKYEFHRRFYYGLNPPSKSFIRKIVENAGVKFISN